MPSVPHPSNLPPFLPLVSEKINKQEVIQQKMFPFSLKSKCLGVIYGKPTLFCA